jgi:hypothetical protein
LPFPQKLESGFFARISEYVLTTPFEFEHHVLSPITPVAKSKSGLKQDNCQKYNPESQLLRFMSEQQLAQKSARSAA